MAGARSSGYRVEGLSSVVRALRDVGLETEDLKDAFSAIADKGAQVMSREAPKRTGRLAGDARGNRAKSKAVVTIGRASLPYAGPINYGWARRGIEPNGFVARTDQAMQPYALKQLEDEVNAAIRRQGLNRF